MLAAPVAVGAAIGTSIAGRRLDEADFETFWAQANAIARPVLVHPAFNCSHPALNQWYLQNAIGNPLETTIAVERLICAGVLARHPQLRLLLMHGGGFLPYQTGRLVHARSVRPELADAPVNAWETRFAAIGCCTLEPMPPSTSATTSIAKPTLAPATR